ncbi:hypothetical protein SASPL_101584 [Salvia splendens]|uniref:Uncharacterized protein n=1 Tax=Salvia splendens TaxID=180675 RepID=A0A8X9ABC5_SALSN|nr:uncharacterized protein LOC121744616 [Salvia splendens]KAG6436682.1 hypothetical protein SASPL_101584 [Salvia splendens]
MTQSGKKHLHENMYPKVKVRVQREDADQYAYEKNSLQSLKAFEWLSLNHSSSSDDSSRPVVRVPQSYVPLSPPPSFYRSKEETNKKKADVKDGQKCLRATSAPRPRAVLSSPENDEIIGQRTPTRTQPSPGLKSRHGIQNRHTLCKIFPKSTTAEGLTPRKTHAKESSELKNDVIAKGRVTVLGDSRIRAGPQRKKIAPF